MRISSGTVRRHLAVVTVVLSTLATTAGVVAPASGSDASVEPVVRQASPDRHLSVGVAYHAFWEGRSNAQRREMFDRIARTGARWVRIGFPWAMVQPRRPTASDSGWSQWGLDQADTVVRMASRQGLRLSFTFVGTPGWANGGLGPKYLPDDPADYARAIGRLASRYEGKVQSWEIWNEANHDVHLKGASVGEYAALLCRAHPAVHRGSRSARVVSAGTGGIDWEWIRQLYRAGTKPCFDVLAVHPYIGDISPHHKYNPASDGPPLWLQKMADVRRVMRAFDDTRTPVWFTEFGWQTGASGVTPDQQAEYLVDMVRMTHNRLPYVRRMSWYTAKDEPSGGGDSSHYGLYTADLRAKPSASALRAYLSRVG